MRSKPQRLALKVAVIYLIVAGGWILFSDKLVAAFVQDADVRTELSIFKGWAFVGITGLLLYGVLRRTFNRLDREADIRRQQAEALREKEESLRSLGDNLPHGYVYQAARLADGTSRFYHISAGVERIHGIPPAEVLKDAAALYYLVLAEDQERLAAAEQAALRDLKVFSVEIRMRGASGHPVWLRINSAPRRLPDGTILWDGVALDISASKGAEAELQKTFSTLQLFIDTVPHFIAFVDLEERFQLVNRRYEEWFKLPRTQIIGRTLRDIHRPTTYATMQPHIREVLAGRPTSYESHITGRAGGEFFYDVRYVPRRSPDGAVQGYFTLALDVTERKLAEQALRDSEQRYRQLFEMESDAVLLVDCETHRFVDANLSAQRLYGYSREELLQLQVQDTSAEPEETMQTIGQAEVNIPLRRHRKKDGKVFPVEINASLIEYQGRRCQLGTVRDITARQNVLDMLRETTKQLLEAQRVAGLGSYVFNAKTGLWASSQVLDQLLGIDATYERTVPGWLQIIHPQEREEMARYLREDILAQQHPFDREYRIIRRADQQERWVHGLGELVKNDQGQVVQMIGTIQDITDRKQAEEQLNLQSSALTVAANAIVITDRNGLIKWLNPAFTKLTGYRMDEALGKNLRILKSGDQPLKFYAAMWGAIKSGQVWHGELVNRRKDGTKYDEDMTITPVLGSDGQIAYFVAIKQDITDRRIFDKRLRQAQKMEAIGTLAGGIAHDFNNMLAAMFGFAYLLEQDVAGNAAAQENVAEIIRAATRAKDLVQQILTFSRQREQNRQPIHLEIIVKEVLKFLRASMPASIKIEMYLANAVPTVLADPTQVYQVVMNLATNALHAMGDQPGQLTVALEEFTADEAFVRLHPELRVMKYARLKLTDTGCGMDTQTQERIFEPFFTTKPVGEGTGLGLAVVHGIMQAHEGAITVASRVGQGTTFHLYFPAHASENTEPDTALVQMQTGNQQHVLLVDDEKTLTTMFERLLKRLNYQITTCTNGRDAVALFRANPQKFDLLITDLAMPELNGLAVAQQISALRPGLPILLLSGFSATTPDEKIRAAGIQEVLGKPISLATLAETIHRMLSPTGKNSP